MLFIKSIFVVFIDNNECIQNTDNCTQVCNNTAGGFVCDCWPSYKLKADGVSCEGKTYNCTLNLYSFFYFFIYLFIFLKNILTVYLDHFVLWTWGMKLRGFS